MKKPFLKTNVSRSNLILLAGVVWVIVIAVLFVWNWHQIGTSLMALAESEARTSFEKDIVYRLWASGHGGVYVPVTENTQPNPYLAHLPERDITTPSGKKLTLVNPAFMTRQAQELGKKLYGLRGHITSLTPIRPENAPDPWETEALKSFEKGVKEVFSVETLEGQPYLRFMRPIVTEASCLKCHEQQGYKVGDIRGGISVSTPLAVYFASAGNRRLMITIAYGLAAFLGVLGLWAGNRILRSRETVLQQQQEMYQALVAGVPDIVMRLDRNGRHLFVSDNISEVVDLQPEQFIGKTSRELGFPEAQCQLWDAAYRQVLDSGVPFETEFTYEGKRGPVVFNWRLMPEVNKQGAITSLLSFSRNITAHRRAEQDYQMLFKEMPNGFALHEIICNEEGEPTDYRFLAVNPAFERIIGMKASDIVGRTFLELLPDVERFWIETYGKVALTGEPAHFESYASPLNRYFEVAAFRLFPNQFCCIVTDITRRKEIEKCLDDTNRQMKQNQDALLNIMEDLQAENERRKKNEAALQESEQRFRLLFSSLSDAVFIRSEEDRFLLTNQAASNMLGYSQDELLRMGPPDIFSPEYRKKRPMILQKLQQEGSLLFESVLVHRDGTVVPVEINSRIILYDGKQASISIVRNISDRKRMEQEQQQLQEQLIQAQKMETVGRLAGGVAHDFNNMLSVILGNLEMALEQVEKGSALYADLKEAKEAAKKSADITRQLLTFSRKEKLKPVAIDVNLYMENMLKMLRRMIGEHITLNWQAGADASMVLMDTSYFNQMITNLCLNARDAMGERGTICITTGNRLLDDVFCEQYPDVVPGNYVSIAVQDTGCGMTPDIIAHIFEPFYTTKEHGKGTGLGLATIYGIVKQCGGCLEVESVPGQGSTFTVYLPQVSDEVAYSHDTREYVLPSAAKGHETVLVVEDEPGILRLCSSILEKKGYTVLAASSPAEALKLSDSFTEYIHLLITDVIMPEMNGPQLLERIKVMRPSIKCLYMSGYTADIITRHKLTEQKIRCIEKPFSKQKFVAMVSEILAET